MTKSVLITGANGQDGSILSEILLEKDYNVYGLVRRASTNNLSRLDSVINNPNFHLLYGDVTDISSIINAIEVSQPEKFFHLAAQSFVGESWNQPIYTAESTGIGTLNCLEAIRKTNKEIKFYNAATSELYGKVQEIPQKETTPFYPRSPYGVAKLFGYWTTKNYRESYNMFASSGILFNHESSKRGYEFVTRKISDAVAKISLDKQDHIELGNLDSKRDWGHAYDYCIGMNMILDHNEPDDFILATGQTHSIRDFLTIAFKEIGITNWEPHVKINPKFFRPAEVDILIGDASKAKEKLGWEPKISFEELVKEMVQNDIRINKNA